MASSTLQKKGKGKGYTHQRIDLDILKEAFAYTTKFDEVILFTVCSIHRYIARPRYRQSFLYTVTSHLYRKHLLLIGETEVLAEGRENVTLEGLGGGERIRVLLDSGEILIVQLDQVGAVGLDAGRSDGLGKDRRATSN